jgi:glycerol-3-phosphate dehydrogenase
MLTTIIGPGNMGRALSIPLLKAGRDVALVGRVRPQAESLARELEGLAFLGITLQDRLSTGFRTAWKLPLPGK